jgi:uridine kinase
MNNLICISGSSGVGKSTIANLFLEVLGKDNTIHLNGDDLHKWQRGNINWNRFTHFNPIANNIDMGQEHIVNLLQNKHIWRSFYNHTDGIFDPPLKIEPKPFIIYDSLHALYDYDTYKNSILKIFVETDDELKIEWKLSRDTNKRGYSKEQVLESIEKRKQDEIFFINPQRNNADAILKFTKFFGEVELNYTIETRDVLNILPKIKEYYDNHGKKKIISGEIK